MSAALLRDEASGAAVASPILRSRRVGERDRL